MIEKIKQDIYKDYKISYDELLDSQIVFHTRDENDNWNGIYVPFKCTQFKDDSIVISSFSQLAALANTYIEFFRSGLSTVFSTKKIRKIS